MVFTWSHFCFVEVHGHEDIKKDDNNETDSDSIDRNTEIHGHNDITDNGALDSIQCTVTLTINDSNGKTQVRT